MPTLTAALTPEGAMVDVHVGLSASTVQGLRTALQPVPPPVSARALLDTGAEITCLDSSVIQTLGLPPGGWAFVNLPAQGGVGIAPLYEAGLTVLHPSGNARDNLVVGNLNVYEVPLAGLGYQALIGRDVLARCRFLYNGRGNRFRLAY